MTWLQTRLKYLCIDAGQYGLNVPADQYLDDGIRLIRTSDISTDGSLKAEDGVYVDSLLGKRHALRPGDLLLSRSGSLGRSFLVPPLDESVTFAGFLIRFRPGPPADPRFLAYVATSKPFQAAIESDAVSSTIQNFNAERYANIGLTAPHMEEQRRIADFLDAETARIDALNNLTELQSALELQRLQIAMRGLTIGIGGPMKQTGITWMPMVASEWRLPKVSWQFRTGTGTTPTSDNTSYFDGGLPWVNSGDLRNTFIDRTERTISGEAVAAFSALRKHPAGCLIIGMYGQGETKGRVGLLRRDAYLNQACCALFATNDMATAFAFYWFRAYKDEIVQLAVGAGQPNLSQELIRQLRIPMPDPDVQAVIIQELDTAEATTKVRVDLLQRRKALLTERRQALITAAVTGQLDVTTARGADLT